MKATILFVVMLLSSPAFAQDSLLELRTKTEHLLGQDTAGTRVIWSDPELNRWINAGCRFVATISGCRKLVDTVLLLVSTVEYDMNADYIRMTGASIHSKGSAIEIDVSPYGLSLSTSQAMGKLESNQRVFGPRQVQDLGRTQKAIRVTPMPIDGDDTLFVEYNALPINLAADADTTGMPQVFDEVVPLYAAYRAQIKQKSDNPFWILFQQELVALIPTLSVFTEPEPPSQQVVTP